MGDLTRLEKRIVKSAKVYRIFKFIADETDEERRCRKLVEALRILGDEYSEQSGAIFDRLCLENILPKSFCREIGRGNNPRCVCTYVVTESANITVRKALESDEAAFSTMYEWLQSDYAAAPMISSIFRENGTELMEILVREEPDVVCHLLQKGSGIYGATVDLLEKVARKHPSGSMFSLMISDILEDCIHSEHWRQKANRILKIARIVNPVHPPREMVRVDTAYLMNWAKRPYFSNPESSEIQDLIRELCKSVCGSPALESLHEILEPSRTIDLLMFLPQGVKRYRGHDIHLFNVTALGLFFLDTHVRNNLTLEGYIADAHIDQFPNPGDVKKAWLLTSLLHDHALPLSYMFKIAHRVYDITGDENLPQSYRDAVLRVQRALKLTYKALFSKPLLGIYSKFVTRSKEGPPKLGKLMSQEMARIGLCEVAGNGFDHFDHGVLAATNVTSRFKNTHLDKIVELSAKAVAVHNLSDKKIRISFKKEPLTFLLVLCDELQEWGREIAVFPEILMDISSMAIGRFLIDGGERFFQGDLRVSFRLLRNDDRTKFDPIFFSGKKKEFFAGRLEFDDPEAFPHVYYDDKVSEI